MSLLVRPARFEELLVGAEMREEKSTNESWAFWNRISFFYLKKKGDPNGVNSSDAGREGIHVAKGDSNIKVGVLHEHHHVEVGLRDLLACMEKDHKVFKASRLIFVRCPLVPFQVQTGISVHDYLQEIRYHHGHSVLKTKFEVIQAGCSLMPRGGYGMRPGFYPERRSGIFLDIGKSSG